MGRTRAAVIGTVAAAGVDGIVRLWDLATGQRRTWSAGQGEVRAVAFAPGGDVLATGGNDVRLWDPARGQLLLTLSRQTKPVHGLSFTPDGGRLLAAGEDVGVVVYELGKTRQALSRLGLGLGW